MKLRAVSLILLMLVPALQAVAWEHIAPAETPGDGAAPAPLHELVDHEFSALLSERLDGRGEWRNLARRGRLAIAVVDLGGAAPRFASVNGDRMMYAASLPKIAILLAAYASLEDGSLRESEALREDLGLMIRRSSNKAASRVIDRIGLAKIETVLTDPRLMLYDESRGGGLWVGKRYARQGRRIGDPLHGISHGATATQVARFYYLLATGQLINPERSEQMLGDLFRPAINHKFVSAIREIEPRARMYRKSGTWRNWHADSVLVRGPEWRNYILVALVESERGGRIIRDLVPMVESALKEQRPVRVATSS